MFSLLIDITIKTNSLLRPDLLLFVPSVLLLEELNCVYILRNVIKPCYIETY